MLQVQQQLLCRRLLGAPLQSREQLLQHLKYEHMCDMYNYVDIYKLTIVIITANTCSISI